MIALVITIIVLIILAGISITMISGQDGILTRAGEAKVSQDLAETMEQIKLELIGKYDENGEYSNDDVIETIKNVTGNDVEVGDETVLTKIGNRLNIYDLWAELPQIKITGVGEETESRAVALKVNIGFSEDVSLDESWVGTVSCNNQTENIDSQNLAVEFAIIQNGEYDVKVNIDGLGSLTKKITITNCKTETFSSICSQNTEVESDGYTVIVPTGFAYGISDNVKSVNAGFVITDGVDANGNSTGSEFVWIPVDKTKLTVGNTDKVIAEISEETNYKGVFYKFNEDYTSTKQTDTGYTDNIDTEFYNEIIDSVKKYGGFYIARYELGCENGVACSKIGVFPKLVLNWSNLNDLAYTYTNDNVTSLMILGSQWDAMLNFVLEGNDKTKILSTNYASKAGKVIKTGLTRTSDKINNIYDLSGNAIEWTSEKNFGYRGVDEYIWDNTTRSVYTYYDSETSGWLESSGYTYRVGRRLWMEL